MIRKLLVATAIIASVVLTACSDMTAPKNDCPIVSGSSTCAAH
jgi:outer membrane biogenesis lipoprotein LolB